MHFTLLKTKSGFNIILLYICIVGSLSTTVVSISYFALNDNANGLSAIAAIAVHLSTVSLSLFVESFNSDVVTIKLTGVTYHLLDGTNIFICLNQSFESTINSFRDIFIRDCEFLQLNMDNLTLKDINNIFNRYDLSTKDMFNDKIPNDIIEKFFKNKDISPAIFSSQ